MFRNYVIRNFPFLEDDFDALTDYQLFCKICGYVVKYAKDNKEMMAKIKEFQDYFDNLDVQEEIDNKLDEMAEDGTLAEIINEEIFSDLNDEIQELEERISESKSEELVDNVQSSLYANLSSIFGGESNWGVSMCFLKDIGDHTYGIIGANDYTTDNPTYIERFNLRTFRFDNGVVSNVTETASRLDGHVNSVADIGNNKILICATPYFYIYSLLSNTYTRIDNPLQSGWISMVTNDDDGNVYGCQDWNYSTSSVLNRFYTFNIDNVNDTLSIASFKDIPNLKDRIQKNEQGMVYYNGLLIFPSFSTNKFCIYNFNTFDYIKTQQIVAPYEQEYEDGFIYNGHLLMIDSYGKLLEPDIYGKNIIGDYNTNNITRSNTDICLLDEPVKIRSSEYADLKFSKYLCFMNNNNDADIGTFGSKLESITIYCAIKTYDGSNGIHNLAPIEIPLYKKISYTGDTINWMTYNWQTNFMEFETSTNKFRRFNVFGTYSFRGSATIPQLRISLDPKYLEESFVIGGEGEEDQYLWTYNTPEYPASLYITKIIGHKKVGLKY